MTPSPPHGHSGGVARSQGQCGSGSILPVAGHLRVARNFGSAGIRRGEPAGCREQYQGHPYGRPDGGVHEGPDPRAVRNSHARTCELFNPVFLAAVQIKAGNITAPPCALPSEVGPVPMRRYVMQVVSVGL